MSKYGNIKTTTSDGITHDSIKEANRWCELKLLERAGKIRLLQRQVKYALIPKQEGEREVSYIADFVYHEDGKLVVDTDICNNCGRCIGKGPFGAVTEDTPGYKVYIGGRWGKKVGQGTPMSKVFTSEEEVLDIVEKIILFFKDQGVAGERLADTVERVGFEKAEAMIVSNELFERKAEILAKE